MPDIAIRVRQLRASARALDMLMLGRHGAREAVLTHLHGLLDSGIELLAGRRRLRHLDDLVGRLGQQHRVAGAVGVQRYPLRRHLMCALLS